jgi:hypothetical protein
MKKILVAGAILLFIGVAVAPSINLNVVKASNDNDPVEVTTQACGINGYGNTTVKLTREQYRNLEQYLVDFRARLNQTTTREEAVPIFKEAVVELNKYGLLPKGMSTNQALRLITKSNDQRLRIFNSLELDPDANYFCLVSGITTKTVAFGPIINLISVVFTYLCRLFGQPIAFYFMFGVVFSSVLPFGLLSLLAFGNIQYFMDNSWEEYPSSGWVYSNGLNGVKIYEGPKLWGTAREECDVVLLMSCYYPGVLGFTGLKLSLLKNTYFLGSALKVKLGTHIIYP